MLDIDLIAAHIPAHSTRHADSDSNQPFVMFVVETSAPHQQACLNSSVDPIDHHLTEIPALERQFAVIEQDNVSREAIATVELDNGGPGSQGEVITYKDGPHGQDKSGRACMADLATGKR